MQTPFIRKLNSILDNDQLFHIISWTHNQVAIEIKDQEKFQKQVLPQHFRHSKMPSFIRQLNLYGFRKIRSSVKQTYTHTCLQNGKSLLQIKCKKKMGNRIRNEEIGTSANIAPAQLYQNKEVQQRYQEKPAQQIRGQNLELEEQTNQRIQYQNGNIKQIQYNPYNFWYGQQNIVSCNGGYPIYGYYML